VLGHRGYRARYPENTLLAFREALAAGADGVECDLQKSADGHYVVIHDASVDRVTGARGDVARMSLVDLRRLDFGSGESIATLENLLSALPSNAYLDLELKEETLVEADCGRIAALLDARRDRTKLLISSFEWRLLVPFRRMGFTVGCLVGEAAAARGFGGFTDVLLRLRPQFLNLPVDTIATIGPRRASLLFHLLRMLGFSLLFWTVNSAEMAAAVAPHARMIVTDEVERAVNEW
jgi:glycerophosphoryl diester phosphodiesterase